MEECLGPWVTPPDGWKRSASHSSPANSVLTRWATIAWVPGSQPARLPVLPTEQFWSPGGAWVSAWRRCLWVLPAFLASVSF